jgi:Mg2+ and Co2+ transporter CorA
MRTHHPFKKPAALLLAASLLGAQIAPVQAAMVGTAQVLAAEQGRLDRNQLASMLERQDLQRQLSTMGVDVQHARDRVASLTDAEVAQINQRLAELPAGGDVLGVLLLILIIFIITDALGATDIFPFVRPIN